jgi:heme/copper-type cytochrome/quinol oxidase subunit 3
VTGTRDTLVTSPVDARPQFVLRLPIPGWAPLVGALFTAAFFFALTFKLVFPAAIFFVVAIAGLLHWAWHLDPPAGLPPVGIGGGIKLPLYVSGPVSQAWWAMVVLMLVAGSLYACALFSYLYLWTVSPEVWPRTLPEVGFPLITGVLLVLSSAVVGWANRGVTRSGDCRALWLAVVLILISFGCHLAGQREVSPTESAYGAIVYAILSIDGFFIASAIVLALFALARRWAGRLDRERRVSFDNARLFWHYAVAQTLAGLLMVQGFPRLVG